MRKCITIILMVMMVPFLISGCAKLKPKESLLDSTTKSEYEAMENVEKTVIKAIETKDRDLIKSLFSKKALKYAGDIDEGIDFLFAVYEGDFVKIIDQNHMADGQIEDGKFRTDYAAWCVFETTEGEYRLEWQEFIVDEFDKSNEGVCFLRLLKNDNEGTPYYVIYGIAYPERFRVQKFFNDVYGNLTEKSILDLLSIECKSNTVTEENVRRILQRIEAGQKFPHIWVTYTEINGERRQNVYAYLTERNPESKSEADKYRHYLLYFNYDVNDKEKISVMKLTKMNKMDKMEDFHKYDVGEDIMVPGVYLSKELEKQDEKNKKD